MLRGGMPEYSADLFRLISFQPFELTYVLWRQHLGPSLARAQQRLAATPGRHLRVMPRKQHIRHAQPAKFDGPRVLRILEQALERMRLIAPRFTAAEHTRQQSDDGVERDHSRELTTSDNEVANRDFLRLCQDAHTFVDTLVATAHQDEVLRVREVARHRLGEALSR